MISICHVLTASMLGDEQRTMLAILDHIDPGRYESHVVSPPGGPLESELKKRHVDVHYVPELSPAGHRWQGAKSYWRVRGILEREHIHLVHNHTTKARLMGTLAARRARVPWIINHVHGFAFHAYSSLWASFALERLEARIAKMATWTVLANHHDRKQAIARELIEAGRSQTIYNGTNVGEMESELAADEREQFRRAHQLADRDVAVAVTMPLEADTQPLLLPEIAASLSHRQLSRRWRILLAGEGRQRAVVESLVRARGLSRLISVVDGPWRPRILAGCDVLLHPSLHEGLPLSVIDALADGIPVVASDIAGNRELVPRNTGFLVEPKDPDDYAEMLGQLIDNPLLRHKLGRAGRERAIAHFDADKNIPQVLALYDQISGMPAGVRRQAA